MATLEHLEEIVGTLPSVDEGLRFEHRTWFVEQGAFLWQRPFSKADLKRFGEEPVPQGLIFGLTTGSLEEKEAILAMGVRGIFTIPHFDGYPAVLIALEEIGDAALTRAIEDAWMSVAPEALVLEFQQAHGGS